MSKFFKICIFQKSDQKIEDIYTAKIIFGNGIVEDRYFNENNDKSH